MTARLGQLLSPGLGIPTLSYTMPSEMVSTLSGPFWVLQKRDWPWLAEEEGLGLISSTVGEHMKLKTSHLKFKIHHKGLKLYNSLDLKLPLQTLQGAEGGVWGSQLVTLL